MLVMLVSGTNLLRFMFLYFVLCYLFRAAAYMANEETKKQQCIVVVDPGTHMSFLFARCRPTRPRYAAAAALDISLIKC